MFKAVLIEETDEGPRARLAELDDADLPGGAVSVDVAYSSLNYKDALGITGSAPIARSFPMVAGIDLAGTVSASDDAAFAPGDAVLATGFGIGERHWGGLAQRARLDAGLGRPGARAVRRAPGDGDRDRGLHGDALRARAGGPRRGPGDGPVLVTGAAGGVGSVAVALLGAIGHEVIASTGRPDEADYLRGLGAADILDRAELSEPGKALAKERWTAAVDTVGGQTLANVLRRHALRRHRRRVRQRRRDEAPRDGRAVHPPRGRADRRRQRPVPDAARGSRPGAGSASSSIPRGSAR